MVENVHEYGDFYGEGGGGRGERGEEGDETQKLIRFRSQNSRNGGLDLALRGMSQANLDLVLLHGTNITSGV